MKIYVYFALSRARIESLPVALALIFSFFQFSFLIAVLGITACKLKDSTLKNELKYTKTKINVRHTKGGSEVEQVLV